jgi:hypothetical protein
MAGDPKEEWLRVALGVTEEALALLTSTASAVGLAAGAIKAPGADPKAAKKNSTPTPDAGKKGGHGNTIHAIGSYFVSIPPGATGKFPLVVIFAGNTGKGVVIDAVAKLPNYLTKAIVVIGERDGTLSVVKPKLTELLAQSQGEIASTSICGYSSGGQAAFANYGLADKKVGLIDPNVKKKDFKKFDSKTIYSFYHPNPESWPWSAGEDGYTIGQARIDAFDLVQKAGGFAEKTKQSHEGYPAYFLGKFESDLI